MRAQSTVRRAARRWHSLVGVRWERWQSQVAGLYHRRVTQPVELWLAVGRLPEFTPHLPWWQPFVWHYLVLTGWRPHRPSSRRRHG